MAFLMSVKANHVSMSDVAQLREWLKLQGHVNESVASLGIA